VRWLAKRRNCRTPLGSGQTAFSTCSTCSFVVISSMPKEREREKKREVRSERGQREMCVSVCVDVCLFHLFSLTNLPLFLSLLNLSIYPSLALFSTLSSFPRTHIDGGLSSDHNQFCGGVRLLDACRPNTMPFHSKRLVTIQNFIRRIIDTFTERRIVR
jgi:hypothetical protein